MMPPHSLCGTLNTGALDTFRVNSSFCQPLGIILVLLTKTNRTREHLATRRGCRPPTSTTQSAATSAQISDWQPEPFAPSLSPPRVHLQRLTDTSLNLLSPARFLPISANDHRKAFDCSHTWVEFVLYDYPTRRHYCSSATRLNTSASKHPIDEVGRTAIWHCLGALCCHLARTPSVGIRWRVYSPGHPNIACPRQRVAFMDWWASVHVVSCWIDRRRDGSPPHYEIGAAAHRSCGCAISGATIYFDSMA